jgi:predicted RNase H-like nuclease (RuvC/YqgF family)
VEFDSPGAVPAPPSPPIEQGEEEEARAARIAHESETAVFGKNCLSCQIALAAMKSERERGAAFAEEFTKDHRKTVGRYRAEIDKLEAERDHMERERNSWMAACRERSNDKADLQAKLAASEASADSLRRALEELVEIYVDVRVPGKIDSFTLQPARLALGGKENG